MSEFGQSPNDQDVEKKSRKDQLLTAMRAAEKWQTESIDSIDNESIRKRKLEGFRRFLRFEIVPERAPDFFIVAGTSPIIDRDGFDNRIAKTVELAEKFPCSKFIFSGHMPVEERVTGQESDTEADMMLREAVNLGADVARLETEIASRHLKENIEFSLRKILKEAGQLEQSLKIAIIASMSMMRRCYYYTKKILSSEEFIDVRDKIDIYCIASNDNLDDDAAVFYEMGRLIKYRDNDWL